MHFDNTVFNVHPSMACSVDNKHVKELRVPRYVKCCYIVFPNAYMTYAHPTLKRDACAYTV